MELQEPGPKGDRRPSQKLRLGAPEPNLVPRLRLPFPSDAAHCPSLEPGARHCATPALRLTKPQHKATQNKASQNLEWPSFPGWRTPGLAPCEPLRPSALAVGRLPQGRSVRRKASSTRRLRLLVDRLDLHTTGMEVQPV